MPNNLNKNKIVIFNTLGDRKLLFIKSFERFYLLKNLMKELAAIANILGRDIGK